MDIIYAHGQATAAQVLTGMHDPPSQTAVRTLLRILEEKGHLGHRKKGRGFVYCPTRPRKDAGRSALRQVLDTFFGGSLERAVAGHLTDPGGKPSADELARLAGLVRRVRDGEK